jgi:hypothetical protein
MRIEPTQPQHDFVEALKKKLRITTPMLDAHCRRKFDGPYASLDRYQVSALIDEMQRWVAVPAELQREQGQLDMFEKGAA